VEEKEKVGWGTERGKGKELEREFKTPKFLDPSSPMIRAYSSTCRLLRRLSYRLYVSRSVFRLLNIVRGCWSP